MKQKNWSVAVDDTTHTVGYTFARLKGKITVTIDGDSFDLPAGFLGLKVSRREIFRLGDEQAILAVDKKGNAELIFRGENV
ncbi:MAG: hypothetical protein E7661_00275 [Ruminococcaceae bacterium]|nr:hypothetical protein [Oscillospiraceae bacterium]